MRSDLHGIEVIYQTKTQLAVCVRETEDEEDVWLPRSQVEIEGQHVRGHVVKLTAPEWLLTEKGLI